MCESSIWLRYPDGQIEKIADDILLVQQEGPVVLLRGLMAEPRRVTGTIREIDSLKHTITLSVTKAPETDAEAEAAPIANARLSPKSRHPHSHDP